KSLYEQIFENKSVSLATDLDPFVPINSNTPDLRGAVKDYLPALSAALGITTADVLLLTEKGGVIDNDLGVLQINATTANDLRLATITRLYAVVTLSNALKLTIKDYVELRALTGIPPFDPAHTENALRFCEEVRKIRKAGFSVAELNYLLRDVYSPS